jgi:hypothetical protein
MDKPSKLDLTRWPDRDRKFVEDLRAVLKSGRVEDVPGHVDLAATTPSGVQDDWYLADPSTYSLLRYGGPGLSALYELIRSNSRADFTATRALRDVVLANERHAVGTLWFTLAYLEEADYVSLAKDVSATVSDESLRRAARRLLFTAVQDAANGGNAVVFDVPTFEPAERALMLELTRDAKLQLHEGICTELENLIARDLPERVFQEF